MIASLPKQLVGPEALTFESLWNLWMDGRVPRKEEPETRKARANDVSLKMHQRAAFCILSHSAQDSKVCSRRRRRYSLASTHTRLTEIGNKNTRWCTPRSIKVLWAIFVPKKKTKKTRFVGKPRASHWSCHEIETDRSEVLLFHFLSLEPFRSGTTERAWLSLHIKPCK